MLVQTLGGECCSLLPVARGRADCRCWSTFRRFTLTEDSTGATLLDFTIEAGMSLVCACCVAAALQRCGLPWVASLCPPPLP